jgi:hypothetical protein
MAGGAVYIDGGNNALINFAFENCTFYKPSKPGPIMGKQVSPILFKNVRMSGTAIDGGILDVVKIEEQRLPPPP